MRSHSLFFCFASLLVIMTRNSHGQVAIPDSSRVLASYKDELNYVQFYNKAVLSSFANQWSGDDRIVIALFGDSHVQPDIYPGEMRRQLQDVRGQGGFGMTFPYSIAKTYSAIDYSSIHSGTWLFSKSLEFRPKLPLGVSGVTAKTQDAHAGFKIKFKKPLPVNYRRLRIYCCQDSKSFDFNIRSGTTEILVKVDSAMHNPIEIDLEKMDSTLEVKLVKRSDRQTEFELYGISIESTVPGGLVLHSLGIGGSRYGSLLEEKLFDAQLPTLQPDLVILDFGTNDFLYDNKIPADLEDQIVSVIGKVRAAVPGVSVLLTSTQDMTRKNINITAAGEFSALIRSVAKNQQCAFYDWYWISGGPEKMSQWVENGLAQKDMIHLNIKGYTLKGQLFAEALRRSLGWIVSGTTTDSLIFNVDSLKRGSHLGTDSVMKDSISARPSALKDEIKVLHHKIMKGETLKSIARRYHVKVDEIKKTNGLPNSRIIEGNYLNIVIKNPPQKPAKTKAKKSSGQKYLMHKVTEGETLSELAEKYRVSVAQIMKLNGLKTSRIKVGNSLKIKPKAETVDGR